MRKPCATKTDPGPTVLRSLSARIFAILAIGLMVIQVISFAAFLAYRGNESKQQMLRFMGADVAFVRDFLLTQPADQRSTWLARLNRGYYTFSLEAGAAEAASPANAENDRRITSILDILRQQLPPGTPIALRDPQPGSTSAAGAAQMQLLLPLDENQRLVLHLIDPFAMPGAATLALYLLAVLLAVTPFVWLAVRLTTRRIGNMLDTIERFGRNLGSPPVPEVGPSELVRAAVAFNGMRQRVLDQLDERTQILAAISHDLQTPLTRLRLRAEALPDDSQRERFVADVEHMSGLVREGLDYARSAHLNEAHRCIEINHWLEGMVDDATDAGADCQLSGRAQAPYRGALRALTRVMQNLIDNALKFGGKASIELEDSSEQLLIRVIDNGPGLADELLERVFDPFFRAETSRNRDLRVSGSGLGLSIARNLVRAHGGDIRLSNRPEGGLLASITLPRSNDSGACGG